MLFLNFRLLNFLNTFQNKINLKKCPAGKRWLTFDENQNRQLNKHLKSGHEKYRKIKPSGFFSKQASLLLMNLINFLIHY